MAYDFSEMLSFSKGACQLSDLEIIKSILPGCVDVRPASIKMDKAGVDYIATLRRGTEIFIDAKRRAAGCSRYWINNGPELAIETWSIMPGGKYNMPADKAKAGWTIDEAKMTDLVLYSWDQSDCDYAFLLPFQPLRIATRRELKTWEQNYKIDIQDSGSWESRAVFVPALIVLEAIKLAQIFNIKK